MPEQELVVVKPRKTLLTTGGLPAVTREFITILASRVPARYAAAP